MLSKRCLTILETWKCKLNKEISTSEEIFESVGIKRSYNLQLVSYAATSWQRHLLSESGNCISPQRQGFARRKGHNLFITQVSNPASAGTRYNMWIWNKGENLNKIKNKGGKLKRMEGKKRSRVRRWCHIPNHCVITIYHLLGVA